MLVVLTGELINDIGLAYLPGTLYYKAHLVLSAFPGHQFSFNFTSEHCSDLLCVAIVAHGNCEFKRTL